MHPDDADRVWKAFAGIREGREMEVEYRWQCSDGTYRWFLDKATSIRRGTDGTIEYSGIWFDIHERRQAEELLRASEERYRTLAQTLPDAVTVIDMQGSITYASPAALKLYGDYTSEEVLGKKFHQWVHAD
jgi:PAS domain-containing protein